MPLPKQGLINGFVECDRAISIQPVRWSPSSGVLVRYRAVGDEPKEEWLRLGDILNMKIKFDIH